LTDDTSAIVGSSIHIDIISRDRNGNVKEHLRVFPDGHEEVVSWQR